MNREPVKTLLIEDDASFTVALGAILEDAPCFRYLITNVGTLAAATALLRTCQFDLILLDLTLPDARDEQAVLAIRSMVEDTPLVVMTGHDNVEIEAASYRANVDDYIVKGGRGIGNYEIRSRIRTAVVSHKAGRRFKKVDRVLEKADELIKACEEDPALPPYDVSPRTKEN